MKNTLSLAAFTRAPSTLSTVAYRGFSVTILAGAEDTDGGFGLFECHLKPGTEPPPHVHEREDELFYLLEGEIDAYVGAELFRVKAGECLFMPKLKPHAWIIRTPHLRVLGLVQPGGFETYFRAINETTSQGSSGAELSYAQEDPAQIEQICAKFGVRILSPEETKTVLPAYPGLAGLS